VRRGDPKLDWQGHRLGQPAAGRQADIRPAEPGRTLGVFQLESGHAGPGRNLHLDKFEEIIASALYRPAYGHDPDLHQPKHGREPIEYDHPWMKEILAETYGIMVYQEQVMQIASKLRNIH